MRRSSALLLAFLLLAFSASAQSESLPARMTSHDNPAPPGQAVTAAIVTAHGSQYDITLRLDEVRFEEYNIIASFTLTLDEVLPAQAAYADYLEQRFGSGEVSFPDGPKLLEPEAFSLITDLDEEYPLTPDGFSISDGEEFEYEALAMVPGEEVRFRMIFTHVQSLRGARIRFQDPGMYLVFAMRPDLMQDSTAWLALE